MKKTIILISIFVACSTSLFAATITQEQADAIVLSYAQSEAIQYTALYANLNEPNTAGIEITTSNDETFRAKYACWTYCLNGNNPAQRRYLFIKKEGGNLLEVIASNDESTLEASSWVAMEPAGLIESANRTKLLYPNPVGDVLTLPCNGANARVEIFDLKGTCLFSGQLSGEDTCQLNVSFLNTGVYMVNVSGEMYKIIKN